MNRPLWIIPRIHNLSQFIVIHWWNGEYIVPKNKCNWRIK